MMTNDDYQHFVCICAGDNPDSIMKEYDKNKKVKPYVTYKYADAKKIKNTYLQLYKQILESNSDSKAYNNELLEDTISELEEMSADEFYAQLVEDNGLSIDEKTGDAISTANDKGKWSYYNIGKIFSIPFLTIDGREVFQARKKDIDWDKIHLAGGDIYAKTWEMVIDNVKPSNEYEQNIYDNMKDKQTYFHKFETKENYVISNTAFWGYAFVSEKNGWSEASDINDQFAWMRNFYDIFIKNLDENTLLTIFECKK